MKAKRRRHEPECTVRGVLEVLKGVQTIEEIAKNIDPPDGGYRLEESHGRGASSVFGAG